MLDIATRIFAYETGQLDEGEVLDLFQDLVDTGAILHLQGSYQRTAQSMLDAGLIHA